MHAKMHHRTASHRRRLFYHRRHSVARASLVAGKSQCSHSTHTPPSHPPPERSLSTTGIVPMKEWMHREMDDDGGGAGGKPWPELKRR